MEYIPAKTIVTRTKSSAWFGSDYNMNLYRGCCHGCIYCDSRSDCYHIEDFERVRAKKDALKIVRNDLRRKVRSGVVATGAMSDPYNPFEKKLELTRHALELIDAYEFGVSIDTKGTLITRDIDILNSIRRHSPVLCKMTITASDDVLGKKIEPNAPLSSERFAAIRTLTQAGLFAGVVLMPVVPFLADNEENIRGIVRQAKQAGAKFIYPAFGMTIRSGQREYFYDRLERNFPGQGLAAKFQKQYGDRYQCTSPKAKGLWALFTEECHRAGIMYEMKAIVSAYHMGYRDKQLSFFR